MTAITQLSAHTAGIWLRMKQQRAQKLPERPVLCQQL
jgi:hypothetical protein